jgi:short chain dehydrogenase
MLLKDKISVVYGAGGGVGSAIARKFAHEGAQVYLTGRRLDPIKKIAAEISNSGGTAKAAELDAIDEKAIEAHLDSVIAEAGKIDISFNAVGVPASLVAEKGCSADGYSVRKLYAADHNLYPHQLPDRTCSGAASLPAWGPSARGNGAGMGRYGSSLPQFLRRVCFGRHPRSLPQNDWDTRNQNDRNRFRDPR